MRRFGPQGWWPLTPPGAISPRYRPGRRALPGPKAAFEVCVGAILTQNTAWTNVEKALAELHRARVLAPESLRGLPRRRLERLIRSSGYFTQKAVKLKIFSGFVVSLPLPLNAFLRRQPLGPLRSELLALHGVGPETADSILLYAGGRPVFVVDAYTKRIGARLGWYPEDAAYDAVQEFFFRALPESPVLFNEFHALFVTLAKSHCRKRPVCGGCPLANQCPGRVQYSEVIK